MTIEVEDSELRAAVLAAIKAGKPQGALRLSVIVQRLKRADAWTDYTSLERVLQKMRVAREIMWDSRRGWQVVEKKG